jgi:hypothetical protein
MTGSESAPKPAGNSVFQHNQLKAAHQPLYRATGDILAVAPENMPDFARAI